MIPFHLRCVTAVAATVVSCALTIAACIVPLARVTTECSGITLIFKFYATKLSDHAENFPDAKYSGKRDDHLVIVALVLSAIWCVAAVVAQGFAYRRSDGKGIALPWAVSMLFFAFHPLFCIVFYDVFVNAPRAVKNASASFTICSGKASFPLPQVGFACVLIACLLQGAAFFVAVWGCRHDRRHGLPAATEHREFQMDAAAVGPATPTAGQYQGAPAPTIIGPAKV